MGASTEGWLISPISLSLSPTLSTSASARSSFGQGEADGREPVLLDRQLPNGAWLEWRVWLSWLAGLDAGFCRVCWYADATFS